MSANFALALGVIAICGLISIPVLSRTFRLMVVGICVGGLLGQGALMLQLAHQLPVAQSGHDFALIGSVVSVPKHDERATSFMFRVDRLVNSVPGGADAQKPQHENQAAFKRLRLSWYGPGRHKLRAGDQWQFVARLKSPGSLGNPGGFNYERWLFQNRIHATGYIRDSPEPKLLHRHAFKLHATRESIAQTISALPDANEFAALVQGLTVGVTGNVTVEHWDALRRSGTVHLLAISGLHIGLISAWFFCVAGALWKLLSLLNYRQTYWRCPKPVFAVCISWMSACVYAALAGFSLPTQRALIMLSVFTLTTMLRRVWPPGSALLFALLIVLVLDPLSVLSVGFWLSFGTVAALFYLHNGRLTKTGKLGSALHVHLKLGIVLLPASAWFFQQGALVAPLANAIAVPVVGLIVVPASFFIALLASSWPSLANVLLIAVQWVLERLLAFLEWLLTLSAANVPLFLPSPWFLIFALLGLVLLFSPRGLRSRWMAVPMFACIFLVNALGKPVAGLELHVLDVGQGLSATLFTANHTVVFDTGKQIGRHTDMVERVLQPFLVSQGRRGVDVTIISHADDDHAGGLNTLLRGFPNTVLYSSEEEHITEHAARKCVAGHSFVLDGVTFSFLHPSGLDFGSRNNSSCVLLVHYGQSRILIAGDIESESEKLLVARVGQTLELTALVAPHHGSQSSSTDEFVELFLPEHVVYAAGEGNKFGFPHGQVVQKYQAIGAHSYITGTGGAVSMRFDKSGLVKPVEQFWNKRRRYRHE